MTESPRRVFLSFLGTGFYEECRYRFMRNGALTSSPTRFIQLARLEELHERKTAPDAIRIFVTGRARTRNWNNHGVKHRDTKETYEGLDSELQRAGWTDQVTAVDVPAGETEDELYEILQAVISEVKDGDELYVDLTHGFRTMPLLLGVALRYLEKVKKVKVVELSYGAFEAAPKEAEGEDKIAPVFDMKPVLALNDWAEAWARFDGSGDVEGLSELVKTASRLIGSRLRADRPDSIAPLKNMIEEAHNALATMRPQDLVTTLGALNRHLEGPLRELEAHSETQLMVPVLERLRATTSGLTATGGGETEEIRAQLNLVRWWLQRHRLQPAAVVLRELLVDTLLLEVSRALQVEIPSLDRPIYDSVHFGVLLATAKHGGQGDDEHVDDQQEEAIAGEFATAERRLEELLASKVQRGGAGDGDESTDARVRCARDAFGYIRSERDRLANLGVIADTLSNLRNAHAHAGKGDHNTAAEQADKQRKKIESAANDFAAYLDTHFAQS